MKRTDQQNKALHKWLDMLAEQLNDSGQSMGDGIVVRLPIRYSRELMKELIVRPYMMTHFFDEDGEPITTTTKLSTTQTQDLYMQLDHIIAELSGCHAEWPSEESLREEMTHD